MTDLSKVKPSHSARQAFIYVRQSSVSQVEHNRESTARQYALGDRAQQLGWPKDNIVIIDDDLGLSGSTTIYFDRWQIEVNHREEKDTLGVGQAQLGNVTSMPKQPVLAVAAYSALLLAPIRAFGAGRGQVYAKLPKWRRRARRPSCLDLIALLRIEMAEQPQLLEPFGFEISAPALTRAAVA